jgi:DedD protein
MPIFSTRSNKRGAEEAPTKNVPIDSIETLRTRARQRLIGAVVLVALGIITFTLLFDSQPRPIPVDIQITMPDKDKHDATVSTTVAVPATAKPVDAPAAVVETPAAAVAAATAAVQASASLSAKEEIVTPKATDKKPEVKAEVKPEAKPEVKPVPKVESKPEAKPVVKAEAKPVAKPEVKPTPKPATDESAKALAILEGKEPPKVATATAVDATVGRFVVQVGAFAENEKAREVRLKVERAGLKTYVHVAETPQGKRIRVRVGPFATRAEADKAAAKIKTLSLPAAILIL